MMVHCRLITPGPILLLRPGIQFSISIFQLSALEIFILLLKKSISVAEIADVTFGILGKKINSQ